MARRSLTLINRGRNDDSAEELFTDALQMLKDLRQELSEPEFDPRSGVLNVDSILSVLNELEIQK